MNDTPGRRSGLLRRRRWSLRRLVVVEARLDRGLLAQPFQHGRGDADLPRFAIRPGTVADGREDHAAFLLAAEVGRHFEDVVQHPPDPIGFLAHGEGEDLDEEEERGGVLLDGAGVPGPWAA